MLKTREIDIKNCHALAYDSSSAIASDAKGTSAVIKGQKPMADSIHCRNHCINIAIVFACKNETVMDEFMDDLASDCYFFPTHLKGSISLNGSSIFIKMIYQIQKKIESML